MWRGKSNQEHLNHYWNALNRGAAPEELARLAEPLDATVTAAIDRARALHRRRRPDPAFATRLEHTIMDAFATSSTGSLALQPSRPGPSNGRSGSRDLPGWLPSLPVTGKRRRWAVAQLAMVALLVFAIVGIYFLLTNDNRTAVVPTPSPTSVPFAGWTNFKGNAGRSGLANAGPKGQPVELWRYQANGSCLTSPIAVDDTVYAACGDGLHALNAATGTTLWQFTGHQLTSEMAFASDLVYIADANGTLFAVDGKTGQERWHYDDAIAGNAPVVDDGLLAVGTPDGLLLGIDAATGVERWRFVVTDQGGTNNAAIANGIVYAGSSVGGYVAVDAATGDERWRADTGTAPTGTATVAGGIAYIGASGGGGTATLFAFDAETGEDLWHRDESLFTPAVSEEMAYSGSVDGVVSAYETSSGDEVWRVQVGEGARPPAVAGSVVYVPDDGDQTVYALDAATGAELWRFQVDGHIDSSVAVADGVLYVDTDLGYIYAIGGSDQTGPVPSPSGHPATVSPSPEAQAAAQATPTEVASPTGAETSPVEFLWQTEGGAQPFDIPGCGCLAIAPDGNLWVADGNHSVFQIFAPDGVFIEEWGVPGSADGQFNFIRDNGNAFGAIAFAPDGSFYVADTGNQRVQHFAADRTFLNAWGGFGGGDGQFVSPLDIAIDPDGNVFVDDDRRSDIQKFDADGNFLLKFGGPGSGPGQLEGQCGLAVDAEGNVWVADCVHQRIVAWDNDGNYLTSWGEDGSLGAPSTVTFDPAGNLVVIDAGSYRVLVLDRSGAIIASWGEHGDGDGQFRQAMSDATVDSQGNVYVSSFDEAGAKFPGVVQKFRLLPPLGPEATPTT